MIGRRALNAMGVLGLGVVAATCGGDHTGPTELRPAAIAAVSGNAQTGIVGRQLDSALFVVVTTQAGQGVPRHTVTWEVVEGGGSVTTATTSTDGQGRASVRWILGTVAGSPQRVTANSPGLAGSPVSFTATARPGPPASLTIAAGNNQTAAAGSPVPIAPSVTVKDQFGNLVPGAAVSFAVASGGGSLTGANVTSDAQGVATLGSWTLGTAAGENTLTASVAGITPVTFTATGIPGAAATVTKSAGDGQSATVGSAVAVAPQVTVQDVHGNAVPGVEVVFAVASGGGSITAASATTDAQGLASVGSWTLGPSVGENTVSATVTGLSPVTFTATGTPGAPASLTKTAGDAQSATAGAAVAVAPQVAVTDAFGNAVPGVEVVFAVASGGGSVTSGTATTDASGLASVGSWTLGTSSGENTLTATVAGLVPVTFTATGTPGAPATVIASAGAGQSATAGSAVAVPPSVLVRDQNGNPVPGVEVVFAVASGGGSVTGDTATTDAAGLAGVGSWTLGTLAGENTLTATVSGLAPVTFTATGTPGAAATIDKTAGDDQSATVGSAVAVPPSVLVRDANGNPVPGIEVVFAVASGGGGVTGGTDTTDATGLAGVGSWTLGTAAGENTLTATAGGLTPVTFTATGTPGAAATIDKTAGDGQSATVGTAVAVAPQVSVGDANGNPVSGIEVVFAVLTGGGSVTGGTDTTDAAGVASAGSWTLGTTAGENTLSATPAGLSGVTFTATGTAGAARSLVKSAGDLQTAVAGSAVGVAPQVLVTDAFGNPVSGAVVNFAVATGGGNVGGAVDTTDAVGLASVGSWTLGVSAGENTLTATVSSLAPVTFTATAVAGAAASVTKTAGDGQSATVGTAVAVAPQVTVLDANGNAVAGLEVVFAVATGGGSLTGGTDTTDGSGVASVGSWTLGGAAGQNTLTAAVGGLAPVTFAATGTPGAAASVSKSAGDGQTATVGTAVATAPQVTVTDAFGNAVPGVEVVFSVTAGGGSVSGGTDTTDAGGVASAGSWTLGSAAGQNTLSAAAGGLAPVSFTATGTAGAPASAVKTAGDGQSATVGTAVAAAPQVTVQDAFGNPVPGVAVEFAVASGGGSVTGATDTTDAGGVASVGSWTLGTAVGENTLTATAGGLAPVTFSAAGTPGAPASLTKTAGDNQSATVGTAVATSPQVLVRDAFNNAVPGIEVAFAVASGGGALTGGTDTTDANGVAGVGSWTLGTTAGSNTLTATASGVAPATFTATGTPGAPAFVVVNAGDAQSATVGAAVAVDPEVVVRDAFGNPVPEVAVTFAVVSGGGSVTGAVVTTGATGLAAVGSWTLGVISGTNTLSATVSGLAPATFTATGTAGTPASLAVVAGDNQNATVGTQVATPPAVFVADGFGNPVSGVSVDFAVTSGGGAVTGTPATTGGSGIGTVGSWTLGPLVGVNTIRATVGSLTLDFTATGTVGSPASITVSSGNNQAATVGTAVATPPSVVVRDANGNVVPGVVVTFAVASGGGTMTDSVKTSGSNGMATLGSWTLGTAAGTNTLSVSASGLTPATVTATGTAGPAAIVAVSAGDNQTATVGTSVATAPAALVTDAFGNPRSGMTVTFAVTSGLGSVTGAVATTGATGVARVGSWTLGTTAGANTLSATVTGLTPASFTATGVAAAAATVAVSAGNGQTAAAGTAVAVSPAVIVRDPFDNPVPDVVVTFAVASGGGSVTGGTDTTDATGVASVGGWTLGVTAGTNTLTGTATGLAPVTFTATGVAGAAASVAKTAGDNQSATVGNPVAVAPSVVVRDANNNVVAGVEVVFEVASGGGSVTGGTDTTDANGAASVGSWTLGPAAGVNTLTATASGVPAVSFTATGIAAASLARQSADPQTVTVNTAVPAPPSVLVKGTDSLPLPGVEVTFTVVSGGGVVTPATVTTDGSGVATATSWTLGTVAGTNTVSASVDGVTPVSFTATGTAAAPASVVVNGGDGQSATVGNAVAIPPRVRVTDGFGNPISGESVTFAVTAGGGVVDPVTAVLTGADGVAAVNSWTLGPAAGTNNLTATAASLAGSPVSFTATGIAAASVAINAGNGQTATVGTAVAVAPSVIVRDGANNPLAGVTVTFSVAPNNGSVTGAVAVSDAGGIATVGGWTLGTVAKLDTLTATVSGLPAVSFTATAAPGSPASVAVNAGDGQSAAAGSAPPVAPSVIVRDANANPVPGVGVSFAVTSGGGSVQNTAPTTDGSGVASAGTWTLGTTAGVNTLEATVTGLPAVNFTATGTAGAPAILSISAGDAQSATVDSAVAVPPAVLVTDANGNPVSGVAVTFTVTSGGGFATGGNATTDASGIATAGSWRLGPSAGTNTLQASASVLTPVTFTATGLAGAPVALEVSAGDGQSATVNTVVPMAPKVTARDANGNPVAGVVVMFAVASGGGSITGATDTSGTDGLASVGSWTLGTVAGTNTLAASSSGIPTVTFIATGTAGAPASVAIAEGNNQVVATEEEVPIRPAVVVRDAFGNPVSGVAVTFIVGLGGGVVTPPANQITDASGIARVAGWAVGSATGANWLFADPFDGLPSITIVAFAAEGGTHSCVTRSGGAAYCWGFNGSGQLGDGSVTSRTSPVAVSGGISFSSVTTGGEHTCGLEAVTGTAYCWGDNGFGQLGDGGTTGSSTPTAVTGGLNFVAISTGFHHTCALTAAGAAFCWGGNIYGQLGDGTMTSSSTPVAVSGGQLFTAIAAGARHTCAIEPGGAAFCWGNNRNGQLGDGTDTARTTPTAVAGGGTYATTSAGAGHSCALTSGGSLSCWGNNSLGQLGDGTGQQQLSPVAVAGTYSQVALGFYHTCALDTSGAALCWGRNNFGQVGDGTVSTGRPVPTAVVGGLTFTRLPLGLLHSCGVTTDGFEYCWGANAFGQLGDGTTTSRSSPTQVLP